MPLFRILNRRGEEIRRFNTDVPGTGDQISVGRSSQCNVSLKHDAGRTVGRMHFVLQKDGEDWVIVNSSRAGLKKEEREIDREVVRNGDIIRFGSCFLAVGAETGPTRFRLVWKTGEEGEEDYSVLWPGRNTVGASSQNTIKMRVDSVSRQHARITANPDDLFVEDLNSTHGTYVRGKRIKTLVTVTAGAELRFGKVDAKVVAKAPQRDEDPWGEEIRHRWLVWAVVLALLVLLAVVLRAVF